MPACMLPGRECGPSWRLFDACMYAHTNTHRKPPTPSPRPTGDSNSLNQSKTRPFSFSFSSPTPHFIHNIPLKLTNPFISLLASEDHCNATKMHIISREGREDVLPEGSYPLFTLRVKSPSYSSHYTRLPVYHPIPLPAAPLHFITAQHRFTSIYHDDHTPPLTHPSNQPLDPLCSSDGRVSPVTWKEV